MSAVARERRSTLSSSTEEKSSPPEATPAAAPSKRKTTPAGPEPMPFLLDFFPLEDAEHTRLAPFFDALRSGALTTTRCAKCGKIHWPPRVACPDCHSETLEWVELPKQGSIYAFSAILAGAPLGMEGDLPFAVGLVDLDGSPLRIFGRIEGKPWTELRIGDRVTVETFDRADGRVFYRFRAT